MALPRESGSQPDAPSEPPAGAPATIRTYEVSALLGSSRELILRHEGSEYRLRIAANGKLILTK